MTIKRIVGSIIETSLRIIVLAIVVMYVHKAGVMAYDFGFRIFAEPPMSLGTGREVTVTIPMGKSTIEVGEILKDHGLIRDERLFFFQELLSAYHGKLEPGEYKLSTSMQATDMMEVMAGSEDSEEEEKKDK